MASYLGRRKFLATLGGAAAVWPLAGRAQQARLPTIGFLGATTPAAESQRLAAFTQRLGELGWIEGRTVAIDVRWAEGRNDRFAEIAAEFVRLRVDVVVTQGTASIIAAKQATAVIPIVFAAAGDPVGAGLVASLARPAGNVTGLSSQLRDTATKRLELLRDVVPNLRRLAIMANVDNASIVLEMRELQATVPALGLDVITLEIHRGEDIAPSFDSLQGRADALVVLAEALAMTNRVRISTLALGARLPTMHGHREYVEAGGLMSYGPSVPAQYRRAADYVDKILRGTKPGDLPVEQPSKFELIINLTTAKTLGLQIPDKLLALADEVIE